MVENVREKTEKQSLSPIYVIQNNFLLQKFRCVIYASCRFNRIKPQLAFAEKMTEKKVSRMVCGNQA